MNPMLRAVVLEPHVDLHRLAWADFEDEQGRGEWADFVRAQVHAAKEYSDELVDSVTYGGSLIWPRRDPLLQELNRARRAHTVVSRLLNYRSSIQGVVRRGFVDEVTVDAPNSLEKLAKLLVPEFPLQFVYHDAAHEWAALQSSDSRFWYWQLMDIDPIDEISARLRYTAMRSVVISPRYASKHCARRAMAALLAVVLRDMYL